MCCTRTCHIESPFQGHRQPRLKDFNGVSDSKSRRSPADVPISSVWRYPQAQYSRASAISKLLTVSLTDPRRSSPPVMGIVLASGAALSERLKTCTLSSEPPKSPMRHVKSCSARRDTYSRMVWVVDQKFRRHLRVSEFLRTPSK